MRPAMRTATLGLAIAALVSIVPAPVPHAVEPAFAQAHGERCRDVRPAGRRAARAEIQFRGIKLDGTERRGDHFSGPRLKDLVVIVNWRNLDAQVHAQRLDLYAPDGSLYRQISGPADDGKVETPVRVVGSWIQQYGLYGTWCIEVFLDGHEDPFDRRAVTLAPPRNR